MARTPVVDVSAVVARELIRLGRVNMPITDFLVEAELSDIERKAFLTSLGQKSPFLYVDAYNYPTPIAMVGTFEPIVTTPIEPIVEGNE